MSLAKYHPIDDFPSMIDAHIELYSEDPTAEMQTLLDDLENDIEFSGVDQVMAIQRQPDIKYNAPLLELSKNSNDLIAGCITWIPISSTQIKAYLDEDNHRPSVRGYHETFTADRVLHNADFNQGVEQITLSGRTLELFMTPTQLAGMIQFADQHPSQRIIADFSICPTTENGQLPDSAQWARQIRELARRPHIHLRLSSLLSLIQGDCSVTQSESVQQYFNTLLAAFGPERIIFGSGWPRGLNKTNYPSWLSTVDNLIHALSDSEKRAIYHHNAAEFYQLEAPN